MFGSEETYATARFALLVVMATINGFNIRTDSMNLFKGIKNNTMFVKIALVIFAGIILLCQFGGAMLHCVPMNPVQWAIIFGLSLLVVPVDLMRKKIMNGGNK
jgi:Ca2+-transporting ATPase